MKKLAAIVLSFFLMSGAAFADTPKDGDPQPAENTKKKSTKPPAKSATAVLAEQLEALRQTLESQQKQIQQLQQELSRRDSQIGDVKNAAAAADAKATEANSKVAEVAAGTAEVKTTTTTLSSDVADLKLGSDSLKGAVQDAQKKIIASESPSSIHYKGITITPGGFFAAETVYRTRAASADDNTPFTGIPYPGNSLAKVSEFNFGGRQTRLSLLAEGKLGSAKLGGYVEADFLGAGTTSNNRQSNSYVLRARQAFGQVAFDNGFSITGGQMWSLATETRKGILNRQEATPLVIDHQYSVGFTWARQYGLRVVKSFHDKFALGAAIEGAQTTIGGRGFSSYQNTAANGTVTASQNFWVNAPGASGGLYNAFDPTGYTTNKAPDFIVKAAFDPGWGHYEVFGILSEFRNRIYPCALNTPAASTTVDPVTGETTAVVKYATGSSQVTCAESAATSPSAAGAFNDSRTGGGGGASAILPVGKKLDLRAKFTGGSGIGRYGSAQLPDVTARPDGTLALIRSVHWLSGFEFHPNAKLDVYGYVGQEYGGRAGYTGYTTVKIANTPFIPASNGQPVSAAITTITVTSSAGGYGSPTANNSGCSTEVVPTGTGTPGTGGTCAGDIRTITEGTFGFWHKVYNGPKGGFRWGLQYSYLTKTGWSGANGISPKAVDNMLFTSFRYYIP
jgi:archaellum component FlaC